MLLRRGVPTLAPSMRGRVVLTLPPLSRSRQRFYSTPNNVPPVVPADVAPVVSVTTDELRRREAFFVGGRFTALHRTAAACGHVGVDSAVWRRYL